MKQCQLRLLLCAAAVVLVSRIGNSQTFGFYNNWSYDDETGYIYFYAETSADYSFTYYYDLYVAMMLHVTPAGSSEYTTPYLDDQPVDGSAFVEDYTTVPLPSDIWLDSYHQVTITYQTYEFQYPECDLEAGGCFGWWDMNRVGLLNITGRTYDNDVSWYAPGPPAEPIEEQRVATGARARRVSLAPPIPSSETTIFTGAWIGFPNIDTQGGNFRMTLQSSLGKHFQNRYTLEQFGENVDGCHQRLPSGPESPAPIPLSPWLVQSDDTYGEDQRANGNSWITYYTTRISSSCSQNTKQMMYIDYGSAYWAFYEQHDIGFVVFPYSPTCTLLQAYRDGVTGEGCRLVP